MVVVCVKTIQDNIPSWHYPTAVATLRLTTGHDCVVAHLFQLRVLPISTLCSNGIMDRDRLIGCIAIRGNPRLSDIGLRDCA
ncbi:hypothetical protein TNCT_657221 [Trichonephila clavata]|uniref:Uncharacterized protein n=1 Tax=Trichonephila clavata TaxID=2740835 RepID=A0A8X6J0M2_TRICU|nr:hypothetical protein TNCT_657221 [Trichonephila clavata]